MLETIFNFYNNFFTGGGIVDSTILTWKDFLQVFVLVLIVFYVYMRFIKNTQSEKLVRGILFFIFSAWVFSAVLIKFEVHIL